MNLPILVQLNPFFEMTSKQYPRRAYYINTYKKNIEIGGRHAKLTVEIITSIS